MAAKLFNAICRNCGSPIKKVPPSNGVKPLTCPACGYTDLYPFDYTGPYEEPKEPPKEPAQEPEPEKPAQEPEPVKPSNLRK